MPAALTSNAASAPETRAGERSEPDRVAGADAGAGGNGATRVPDPEVSATAQRRRFTAKYKLKVLAAVEATRGSGEIGALLRREGLFSSHLTRWKAQRRAGALSALAPRRRGPKAAPPNPLARRVAELERETRRLERRLAQSEAILVIQKKVSELLGIPLDRPESDGRTS